MAIHAIPSRVLFRFPRAVPSRPERTGLSRTMITIDKITDLAERLEALKGYLEIEDKRGRILEEEKYTLDPDFWNDQKKAQAVMHKIRELKRWVVMYENVKREVDDAGRDA
jgi:hypothetical protein